MSVWDTLTTLSAIPVAVVAVNLGWPIVVPVLVGWAVLIILLNAAVGVCQALWIWRKWRKQAKAEDGHA